MKKTVLLAALLTVSIIPAWTGPIHFTVNNGNSGRDLSGRWEISDRQAEEAFSGNSGGGPSGGHTVQTTPYFWKFVDKVHDSAPITLKYGASPFSIYKFGDVSEFNEVTHLKLPDHTHSYSVLDKDGLCRVACMEHDMVALGSAANMRKAILNSLFHCVDFNYKISETEGFLDAFRKDVNERTDQQISKDGYAHLNNAREAWAEAAARQLQAVSDTLDHDLFNKDFANTITYVRDLFARVHMPMVSLSVVADAPASGVASYPSRFLMPGILPP
jgi:hypothetical protein